MKILSDNPQILKELSDMLTQEGVVVKLTKVKADKDDKGIVEDIVQFIIENPELTKDIIEVVFDEIRKLHRQEHIYVVKKNGKKITYETYKKMSLAERSEHIF